MTNYDKALQEMTLERMAILMDAIDECVDLYIKEDFTCEASEEINCVQCIKNG